MESMPSSSSSEPQRYQYDQYHTRPPHTPQLVPPCCHAAPPHAHPPQCHPRWFSSARPLLAAAQPQRSRPVAARQPDPDALEVKTDIDKLTDMEMPPPVGVVEGTSYSVVILVGLAIVGVIFYALVDNLLYEPKEVTCFNLTLERLRNDPRVSVRLGPNIKGFGHDSMSRHLRRIIPHHEYTDPVTQQQHVQVQFHISGQLGKAQVTADMYQDPAKEWQYRILVLELLSTPRPQRLILEKQEGYAL